MLWRRQRLKFIPGASISAVEGVGQGGGAALP